jgi:murein DD-endopeptidase MepM/ murein hydrolase activator NlpD
MCRWSNELMAQDKDELEEQNLIMLNKYREREAEEISNINKLLESIDKKQQSGLYSLSLIQKKIDSRKSTLNTIDRQISLLKKQLEEKKQTVELLQNELQNIKHSYKELINRYYNMQAHKSTWVMYIMASESMAQAYRRMKYVREILFLLKAQADKIITMTDRLNAEIETISKKQSLLSSNISAKQKEMAILNMEEKQSKTVYSELKQREGKLKQELMEREKSYAQLSDQLRDFIRKEIETNNESGITDEMLVSAQNFEQMKGFLPQPAIGVIIVPFGRTKKSSIYESVQLTPNQGIDILTVKNAEVYSIFKGVVKRIFTTPNGMLYILISHGSYYTAYASLESASVKVGDTVMPRQKIGTVKNSKDGSSVLHFELWKDGKDNKPVVQNPEHWILTKLPQDNK